MPAVSSKSMSGDMTRVRHTRWCTHHTDDPTPEAGWCRGDSEIIGGFRTSLTQGLDGAPHEIHMVKSDEYPNDELDLRTAQQLAARLSDLAEQAMPADETTLSILATMHSAASVSFDPDSIHTQADARRASRSLGNLIGAPKV